MDQGERNTLSKSERLSGKKNISGLLAGGRYGNTPGMRFCYITGTGNPCNRIIISVPKKNFRRAVKRNLLKRRIRESYRRQKHNLKDKGGIDILFIYNSKAVMSFGDIWNCVSSVIDYINESKR